MAEVPCVVWAALDSKLGRDNGNIIGVPLPLSLTGLRIILYIVYSIISALLEQ